ncbi:MAG: F0F1 ATP synthase subunit A [Bacteroidota bacterium]|jgi:F-type H+-transporting ATPase subunit a
MRKLLILFVFCILSPLVAKPAEGKDFNAGQMIMEHITDAHEWHILTLGHVHVSIPLPVILLHQGHLYVFSFSRFHHGEQMYKGFKYMTQGPLKGKIVYLGSAAAVQPMIPVDLSITKNVLAIFFSVVLLLLVFFSIASYYRKNPDSPPRGLAAFIEPIILFVRDDIAKSSIGEKNYERYTPYLLTVFFFIFFNNLLGLVPFFPGGANVTGNITVTLVLALFTFIITTISGNRDYWRHIFNAPGVPWWLKIPVPLMPIVELLGVFTKPFVLMVRLFANITAGHIIVLGFISLIFIFGNIHPALGYGVSWISLIMSVFLSLLELLVAFLQAFVFTLLSALYFGMATEEHANHDNHH